MKEINFKDLKINPFTKIGNEWMLVTSGKEGHFNTMTASWGSLGALWGHGLHGRPTATIYIRPSRYTDSFIDENELFTLSFFDEEYRNDLLYLGSHSGKDEDKLNKTKITPLFINETVGFNEANLILVCKKIYKGKIFEKGFVEKDIIDKFYKESSENIYNNNSFHNVYVGEIIKVLIK